MNNWTWVPAPLFLEKKHWMWNNKSIYDTLFILLFKRLYRISPLYLELCNKGCVAYVIKFLVLFMLSPFVKDSKYKVLYFKLPDVILNFSLNVFLNHLFISSFLSFLEFFIQHLYWATFKWIIIPVICCICGYCNKCFSVAIYEHLAKLVQHLPHEQSF